MIGIDTNIILNVLRKDDPIIQKKHSLEFFKYIETKDIKLAVSIITLTELFRKPYTNKSSHEREIVDSFLHVIDAQPISIGSEAAIEAARLIGEHNIGFADALIAASVRFAGIKTFITRNISDYKHTGLEVLTPEQYLEKYE